MIRNLSNEQLAIVASYLPSTSRASFSVALSATSPSPGELSGVFGDELDFTNMEELSDEVLRGVLLSIDAKNTLKTLSLEGCSQIVGHGLEPLRESTKLERLDLPRFGNGLLIDIIIPLIVSMRNRYLGLLRYLRFPEEWASRDARNDQALYQELERINQLIPQKHNIDICFECYDLNECSQCNNCGISICNRCEDFTCCDGCKKCYCYKCEDLDHVDAAACCDMNLCTWCDSAAVCHGCKSVYCELCSIKDEVDAAIDCGKCPALCSSCASDCLAAHSPKLIEENDQLKKENERLLKEIEELKLRKRKKCDHD